MRKSDDRGQSLVEVALTVPLLLLVAIGLADFGRGYYYSISITNAAREAAAFAARDSDVTAAEVAQVACDETGLVPYGDPCPAQLAVTYSPAASADWDESVTVTVTYDVELISRYLVGRVIDTDELQVRATARFPRLR